MRHAAQWNSLIAAVVVASAIGQRCGAQQSLAEANRRAAADRTVAATLAPALDAGAPVEPPATIADALQQMASSASRIFVGTVSSVTEQAGGAVVEFAIEEALRGVDAGKSCRIRVSAWGGGVERYRVGQRALYLLHAPSAAGYTSPVAGGNGIVPLEGDAWTGTVDLRWIATGVMRFAPVQPAGEDGAATAVTAQAAAAPGSTFPGVTTAGTTAAASDAARLADTASSQESAQRAQGNVTGVDVHAIDRDLVTGLLRTWQASTGDGAAR